MTWRELKNYINKSARSSKEFLDNDVKLYDFSTGDEHDVDITELLCGEEESELENSNWVSYLSINQEELNNEDGTEEEASIN